MNRKRKYELCGRGGTAWVATVIMATSLTNAADLAAIAEDVPVPLQSVRVDRGSGQVTLRWQSEPGKTYLIEETADPQRGWVQRRTRIEGDRDETSLSFLPLPTNYGSKTMLFRVREMDLSISAEEKAETERLRRITIVHQATGSALHVDSDRKIEYQPIENPQIEVTAQKLAAPASPEAPPLIWKVAHSLPMFTGG